MKSCIGFCSRVSGRAALRWLRTSFTRSPNITSLESSLKISIQLIKATLRRSFGQDAALEVSPLKTSMGLKWCMPLIPTQKTTSQSFVGQCEGLVGHHTGCSRCRRHV